MSELIDITARRWTYESLYQLSLRPTWEIDDILAVGQELDFSRNMMPEKLARTSVLGMLEAGERRLLNQISAHQYLFMFRIFEESTLPFVLDPAQPMLSGDDWRVRAVLNFACEQAKHIHLFKRLLEAFDRGFPVARRTIGPVESIAKALLRHDPLSLGLFVLMVEWSTQGHYLASLRDEPELDPLFAGVLRHHWLEEGRHALVGALRVESLALGRDEGSIGSALDELFEIFSFLDAGLRRQAEYNIEALEQAIGFRLSERHSIIEQQHQAARWTFIGSAMVHPSFVAVLEALSPVAAKRVAREAPMFA